MNFITNQIRCEPQRRLSRGAPGAHWQRAWRTLQAGTPLDPSGAYQGPTDSVPSARWARSAQGGTPAIVRSALGVPPQDPIRGVPGPHWQRAKRTLGAQRAGETASNRYGGWKNLQVKNQRLDVTHGMPWIVPQAPPPPSAMLTAMVPTQVKVDKNSASSTLY